METNEIIALSIVALAVLLALRCFFNNKGGGCCGSGCLFADRPGSEKKDKAAKPGDKA
jgi:hypothetical protein